MPEYNSTSAVNPRYSTSAVNPGSFHHWNSPLPYLFGGLALMLGLIALALLLLACSYRKSPHNTQSSGNDDIDDQEKSSRAAVLRPEMEPRIVVIMAGDHNPTYLAKPTTTSIRNSEEV